MAISSLESLRDLLSQLLTFGSTGGFLFATLESFENFIIFSKYKCFLDLVFINCYLIAFIYLLSFNKHSIMSAENDLIARFQTLGMSEQKAKETLKNANVTKNLQLALAEIKNNPNLSDGSGMLLYHLASKIKPQIMHEMPLMVRYIVEHKLDSTLRVDAALEYLLKNAAQKQAVNTAEFEKECGVGVVVTPEEIEKVVQQHILLNKQTLLEQRYHFNSFKIMQDVRTQLKWADAKQIKSAIDVEIFDLLGPKTEEDLKPLAKGDKKKEKPKAASNNAGNY